VRPECQQDPEGRGAPDIDEADHHGRDQRGDSPSYTSPERNAPALDIRTATYRPWTVISAAVVEQPEPNRLSSHLRGRVAPGSRLHDLAHVPNDFVEIACRRGLDAAIDQREHELRIVRVQSRIGIKQLKSDIVAQIGKHLLAATLLEHSTDFLNVSIPFVSLRHLVNLRKHGLCLLLRSLAAARRGRSVHSGYIRGEPQCSSPLSPVQVRQRSAGLRSGLVASLKDLPETNQAENLGGLLFVLSRVVSA